MATTFAAVLTAHLLGYLIYQAKWFAGRQRWIWALALHAAVVTLASYLLLGTFHWQILLAIFLTHFVLGAIQACILSDSVTPLLVSEFVHLAVLLSLACYFPDVANGGWWIAGMNSDLSRWYFASLSFISGIILCVPFGGNLIAKLTGHFADELGDNNITGLKQGGQYIGWLERFLVMLLLLMNQPNGIGFLIAAKSILRFGEIKDASQRKVAEYIIIGTFLSFGWALVISALTQLALKHWMP
jgi:hypothetical protein